MVGYCQESITRVRWLSSWRIMLPHYRRGCERPREVEVNFITNADHAYVTGDYAQLVVRNLVDNAEKYGGSDKGTKVQLEASERGWFTLAITDHGVELRRTSATPDRAILPRRGICAAARRHRIGSRDRQAYRRTAPWPLRHQQPPGRRHNRNNHASAG